MDNTVIFLKVTVSAQFMGQQLTFIPEPMKETIQLST